MAEEVSGDKPAAKVVPVCGEDFCDACGDCLNCYSEEACFVTHGEHVWIKNKNG